MNPINLRQAQATSVVRSLLFGKVSENPFTTAVQFGLILGFVSVIVTVAVVAAMAWLLPEPLWGKAASAGIENNTGGMLLFSAVFLIPLIETFEGQVLPIEIVRRLGGNDTICAVLSALIFALGHYLNGGLAHGMSTLMPGLIFAIGYVSARSTGPLPSILAAYTAHGFHNALMIYVVQGLLQKTWLSTTPF